jgi:hypothetical protein
MHAHGRLQKVQYSGVRQAAPGDDVEALVGQTSLPGVRLRIFLRLCPRLCETFDAIHTVLQLHG